MRISALAMIAWILIPLDLYGQLEVSGQFSSDTIEIGGEVQLILSILKPENIGIKAVERGFIDSIYSAYQTLQDHSNDTARMNPVRADYEVLDYGLWQEPAHPDYFDHQDLRWTTVESGQSELLENRFTVRLWDPGENFTFIPPVLYEAEGEGQVYYKGGVVRIFVSPPAGMEQIAQDSLDLAPIKTIIAEERNISDYVGIVYGLGALLIAVLGYYVFTWATAVKERDLQSQEMVAEPPHLIALEALQKLKEEKLWQAGDVKGYQSRLTYIIRQYIENRFDIHALEATTDRIVKEVGASGLEKPLVDVLSRVLHVADLVKFAKAKPDLNIHDQFMDEAIHFVRSTITMESGDAETQDHLLNKNVQA